MYTKTIQRLKQFLQSDDGPTTVEYALLLALLAGMMIASILYVGDQAQGISNDVVVGLDDALNN